MAEVRTGVVFSMADVSTDELNQLLFDAGITARPLFGVSEERLRLEAATTASVSEGEVPDLSKFYRVDAPDDQLDASHPKSCFFYEK